VKVAVTGATGTIGRAVVEALLARGDEVAALSRSAERAHSLLGERIDAHEWRDPKARAAPSQAFQDCDAVVHLLGEPIAQRWSEEAKREIRDSRVRGTRNLIAGLREAGPRLKTLVSQSAVGVYGFRGDEELDESARAGDDFLASVVTEWEAEAARAEDELGVRTVLCRTGVVLSSDGGALEKMLPPFKLGVGGPVAGGGQYVPWVHLDDVVGAMLHVLDDERAHGPVNVCAPRPVTNKELSKALGHVLRRPAFAPVPAFAVKLLYGEMAEIVTKGQRVVPRRLEELGYEFRRPQLEDALREAVR